MDFDAHLLETARHLVWMASTPLAREHAKLREQELIASHPMYAVLPELIRQQLQSARSSRSAPSAA